MRATAAPRRPRRPSGGWLPNTPIPNGAAARASGSGPRLRGNPVHDIVDLRSDTLTLPTPAMREAMARAEVGDDVWQEDPTVRSLEEQAARRTGKEAALFVSSGTQGNLVSVLTQTRPGQEIILDADSHIFNYEVAGAAVFGGVQTLPLKTERGFLTPEQVREHVRPSNVHIPVTGLVCLENTHNRHGGTCCTPEEIEAVAAAAHGVGVPVHLDGARIFNAAVALKRPVVDFARPVDSITFCLSKGLGAPVGSLICGSRDFVTRARRVRKMLGGGMRQVGVLAAAGLVALESMVDRLAEDHANARRLAEGVARLPRVRLDLGKVQTNIVIFHVDRTGGAPELVTGGVARKNKMRKIRGKEISMVFQEPMTSLNPVFTCGEQIAEALRLHEGLGRREAMEKTVDMLKLVHIPNAERRVKEYPHQLSGGMRQRIMIAMALSCNPKLLIADEPTTALDVTIQAQILELLNELKSKLKMAVMLITHDMGVI